MGSRNSQVEELQSFGSEVIDLMLFNEVDHEQKTGIEFERNWGVAGHEVVTGFEDVGMEDSMQHFSTLFCVTMIRMLVLIAAPASATAPTASR